MKILGIIAAFLVVAGIAVFGIKAYAHGFKDPRAHAERIVGKIEKELNLTEAQKPALQALKSELLAIYEETKESRRGMHETVASILEQPVLDQAQALGLVEQHVQRVNQYAPRVVAALATFYDGLNPDQQQIMRDKLKEHHEHGGKHRWCRHRAGA